MEGEKLRKRYFVLLVIHLDRLNRKRDAAKKVLCSSSKVHFFIDRSQQNLYQLCRMRSKRYVYSFKEIP
jgi:hypothetical protein